MYNDYYGFRENPFNQTPDSSFFYPSKAHKEALDALAYAIHQRKGFVVITGEIGTGKTTVSRTLLRKIDPSVRTAVITNSSLSPKGIITFILEDLGVPYKDGSKDKLLIQLNEYLLDQIAKDRNVLLMVDEAQNLSPAALEEIRMLSNLETEKEKLLQIILVGQPELRKKLELPALEQLRQRIVIHYHLRSLSSEDTRNYIDHRLHQAMVNGNGDNSNGLFNEEAVDEIFKQSGGVPRVINNICDHALLTAFVNDQKQISRSIAEEASESVLHTTLV